MHQPVDAAKTHEILSRFRPIAPKPHPPANQLPPPAPHRRPRFRKPAKRPKAAPFFPFVDLLQPQGRIAPPPVERDLLQKLLQPKVIAPRPVRPVGSSICVGLINEVARSSSPPRPKRPEEVEEEVESERLPAVVSDEKNRVRMANSAYKEMVGQPECMWLESMDCRWFDLRPQSRRINGEVMIQFSGDSARPSMCLNGFSCRAKIEWACDGRKSFVDAPCDVIRVCCDSKEFLFTWKFHVGETYGTDRVS